MGKFRTSQGEGEYSPTGHRGKRPDAKYVTLVVGTRVSPNRILLCQGEYCS